MDFYQKLHIEWINDKREGGESQDGGVTEIRNKAEHDTRQPEGQTTLFVLLFVVLHFLTVRFVLFQLKQSNYKNDVKDLEIEKEIFSTEVAKHRAEDEARRGL